MAFTKIFLETIFFSRHFSALASLKKNFIILINRKDYNGQDQANNCSVL